MSEERQNTSEGATRVIGWLPDSKWTFWVFIIGLIGSVYIICHH